MYSQINTQDMPVVLSSISLQDFLDESCSNVLTEYLSLSVTYSGSDTHISLTTTGKKPVTYSTVIPSFSAIDLQSLVFVVQGDMQGP